MQITRAPKRHLDPSELVDATRACLICLAAQPRRAVFRVQSGPDVDMLACPRCRACSASHMPRPDVLERYYASYYDDRERQVTFSAPSRFAKHVVHALPRKGFSARLRILDYGGGDGTLSKAIAERLVRAGATRGADVLVIDLAQHHAVTHEEISVRSQSPAETIEGQYDLVLASAILEHIPDLYPLLRKLHAAIAPGGFFYARTPYVIPLTWLNPRLDLTYPAHVHDMGINFWNRFIDTFSWSARTLASRPSLVAGTLRDDPFRTLAALTLKAPAHIEGWLSGRSRAGRLWHLVGGWEVLLQRT